MLTKDLPMVGAAGKHENDDPGARIVSELEPDGALNGLHVIEVQFGLNEALLVGADDPCVPCPGIALDRQGHLALESERRTEHRCEPGEQGELGRIPNGRPGRKELKRRRETQRPGDAANGQQRRVAKLLALNPAGVDRETPAARDTTD